MKEIIKLEKITKEYNHKLILDQVDLSIYEGQSMVFTGHNGSGKSTLLKIISGLVKPSSGKVVYRDKLLFHYVPERFPKMNLTPWQYLKRMGQMDGIPPKILAKRCEKLFSDFFLADMVNIPMKDLSKRHPSENRRNTGPAEDTTSSAAGRAARSTRRFYENEYAG